MMGLQLIEVLEPDNDFVVIGNKLIVRTNRQLTGRNKANVVWIILLIILFLGPITVLALIVAHISLNGP